MRGKQGDCPLASLLKGAGMSAVSVEKSNQMEFEYLQCQSSGVNKKGVMF